MYKLFLTILVSIQLLAASNISIQTVDGQNGTIAGTVPTLHVFNDKVYILYGDETNVELKLVKKENGAFNLIHTIKGTSNASNFDIDSNGNIHICYLKNNGIYYDTNKSGDWVSTFVDKAYSSTWTRIGCSAGANGAIYMSYDYFDVNNNKFQLHYATNRSGSFHIETVLDKGTQYSDLTLGNDDKPYISFSDSNNVYVTYKNDSRWITPKLIGGWLYNSIVYDKKYDEQLVTYVDRGQLYFAKMRDDVNASSYPIDTSCRAQLPSIAIGKKGVGIAYLCSKDSKTYAKVAIIDGKIDIVDDITPTEDGWHGEYGISLDFDSNGMWHIAYYDIKNKDLKYATEETEDINSESNTSTEKNTTKNNFYTIKLQKGWQNIGINEDISTNVFDNGCTEFIWKYDISDIDHPIWKLYVANNKTYNIPTNIGKLKYLKSGDGYWVKSSNNCEVKISNSNQSIYKSKLIEDKDLINKKLELLHREGSSWNVDYWIELSFDSDHTFKGTYNDNITDQSAPTSEIRDNGHKINGTWKITDSKIFLHISTNNKIIILTPITLDIESFIGYETFENGNYNKKIFTIQNYY